MAADLKRTHLDQLARKPVPKHIHQFFTVSDEAIVLEENEPDKIEETKNELGEYEVIVIDKRKSMRIDCESVWAKINRRIGVVFDKRKMKQSEPTERPQDRFVSSHLETALGKRSTATTQRENEEPEELLAAPTIDTLAKLPRVPETEEEPSKEKSDTEPEDNIELDIAPETGLDMIVLPEPIIKVSRGRKSTAKDAIIKEHYQNVEKTTITESTMLNGKQILPRLPKPEKFVIRAPTFYMSNRKLYIQKLNELFKDYAKEIADETNIASCDMQTNKNIQMLIHQRIVRDYLNLYTPYRGLLLYHGLGSGKTCTSIAIAEGMKTRRKIFVMTPASLKMNFFSELKKCGDALYKKKQYWEFVSVKGQPQNVPILSKALSLPVEFIMKYNGAWLMDTTKPDSNFADLSPENQKILDEQLNAMIRTKYVDINYNGLNANRLNTLFERDSSDKEINPFNHSVVVIDEAHNFMSRVSNKLTDPKSVSFRLYDKLYRAENVRIVLLTGTPMINYPNELGILFNLLRGVIRTWEFTISGNEKVLKDNIIEMFKNADFKTYDYIDYANGKLTITRNPFGFINASKVKKGGFMPELTTSITEVDVVSGGKPKRQESVSEDAIDETPGTSPKQNNEDVSRIIDSCKTKRFLPKDAKSKSNTTRRRGSEKKKKSDSAESAKLPQASTRDNEKLETPDLTPNEENQLSEDIRKYLNGMGDEHHNGGGMYNQDGGDQIINPDYHGVYLNEQGNISDEMFVEQVKRILHKNGITITGNPKVDEYKALPMLQQEFLEQFIEDDKLTVKNINLFKKRILGLASYFRSAQEKLLPSFVPDSNGNTYTIVPVEMSDYQVASYFEIRSNEMKTESNIMAMTKGQPMKASSLYNMASSYRIFSRVACNYVFPKEIPRPTPPKTKNITEEQMDNIADGNNEDMYIDENAAAPIYDKTYQAEIVSTLQTLTTADNGKYMTPELLKQNSPKFLRMLENIKDPAHKGLHLVYSNFRSLEGIGIFKNVLSHNGYAEFKLQRNGDIWEIKDTDPDKTKPRFVLYTGTETNDEKEIIRNIYNSQWDLVPSTISTKLREIAENNYYGEVIRIIMITASGAEGINLENTRYVHIMEPYWNMVRVDQVVGRARRICSHKNLPKELQTVQVFFYITSFSKTQATDPKYINIMKRDLHHDTGKPITTDESLYQIAALKNTINSQLLKAIKETAIDCRLYKSGNTEPLVCYGEGVVSRTNAFGIFPKLEEDKIVSEDINVRQVKRKMKRVQVPTEDGQVKVFARYENSNELYDWDLYDKFKQESVVARLQGNRAIYMK
jgi:hypothetical protein